MGLLFYNELLHIFYRLRVSDYKNAVKHVDKLDAAMKQDSKSRGQLTHFATTTTTSAGNDSLEPTYFGNSKRALQDKLFLAPPPINGEWLPKSAVYALVDLMVIIFGRPKGNFKECDKRIQSGIHIIKGLFF